MQKVVATGGGPTQLNKKNRRSTSTTGSVCRQTYCSVQYCTTYQVQGTGLEVRGGTHVVQKRLFGTGSGAFTVRVGRLAILGTHCAACHCQKSTSTAAALCFTIPSRVSLQLRCPLPVYFENQPQAQHTAFERGATTKSSVRSATNITTKSATYARRLPVRETGAN